MKKPFELVLRTICFRQPAQCLQSSGQICVKNLSKDSRSAEKHAERENSESVVVPTEFPNANTVSQTDMSVQGNLLREYEQKFAELPEDPKLNKLWSDVGFLKDIGKGQFFIPLFRFL